MPERARVFVDDSPVSVLFGGEQTVGKAFGAAGFWTTPAADKPKP